ncbi:unnamed protein product, partial [Ectocarpus sp. 12 AP-2014]
DRDGRLSEEDLIKYGEHGLSRLIVDRGEETRMDRIPELR